MSSVLAGVAQWTECPPANQRVTGLIPSQGTCLGCRPGPQQGAHEWQPYTDVSLPLSPSLSFSLRINKIFFKKLQCLHYLHILLQITKIQYVKKFCQKYNRSMQLLSHFPQVALKFLNQRILGPEMILEVVWLRPYFYKNL